MDKHGEMEFKWAADNIDVRKFNQWAINEDPTLYRNIVSPDHYWTQGDSVVRYRPQQGNAGALTVKCRKSKDSITDRLEVDLNLAGSVTARDVEVFLKATGWKHCFTLHKNAHIYWYKFPWHTTTLALYDVQAEGRSRSTIRSTRFTQVRSTKFLTSWPIAIPFWRRTANDKS